MQDMIIWLKVIFKLGQIFRRLHWKKPLRQIRCRVIKGTLRPLHFSFFHEYRELSLAISQSTDYVEIAKNISDICTACNYVMADMLELDPLSDIHCSLKVFDNSGDKGDIVVTWGRSSPHDARDPEIGLDGAHTVENNSVWCALLGRDDTKTRWSPFSCFCCNDLSAQGALFRCDRKNWPDYYKSTLVFPIKCSHNNVESELCKVIGFLTFDSPQANAFEGCPCIFEHSNNWTAYHKMLRETAPFHLGAIMVHSLGEALRPIHKEICYDKI